MEYRNHLRLLVLLLALGAGGLGAAEARIYRYLDNNGKTAFNSFIPPEFAKNGYSILNQKGQVLETVAPTLTREVLATQSAEQEKLREQQEALRAQKEADNILLRLYRAPEDIEHKRDLTLAEFDMQIADLASRLKEMDAELAQLEQNGEDAEIAKHQSERDDIDTELLTLTAKRENAAFGFAEDIERLRYLQGLAKNTAAN